MTDTIGFIGDKSGLRYCPKCRIVYYEKDDCDCDNWYTKSSDVK